MTKKTFINLFLVVLVLLFSLTGYSQVSCSGLVNYPTGVGSYTGGQQVVNNSKIYEAKPNPYLGWANSGASAYEPGIGFAWQDAWIYINDCNSTPSAPDAPSNPKSTASSNTQINISWTDNSANEDLFRIERSLDGSNWTLLTTVAANTTSYSNTGLANFTTYYYRVRAENAIGNSIFTSTVSATTTDKIVVSNKLLIGYWHTWTGGVPFIKLRDVDPNWDVINISFSEPVVVGSTDGKMQFIISGLSSGYTTADFKNDVKALQAKGKKVVLSIGGYTGTFSLTSVASVNQFVSDISGFVTDYGFDGIDIDLEQNSVDFVSGMDPDFAHPTSPKIVNMISAINQICDKYSKNFILSWAPETYYLQMGYQYYAGINTYVDARAGMYIPMIHALRNRTSWVHAQLYNSISILAPDGITYSMGTKEALVAMCKMLLDGFNVNKNAAYFFPPLRPDQVVIGVPSSGGAAGSGQVTNADLQAAFTTLEASYPGMRGIMTWSINWDAFQNANQFAISNGTFLDGFTSTTTAINEYTAIDNNIVVCPLPATDKLYILSSEKSSYSTTIYDLSGRILKTEPINDFNSSIDISDLASGMYLINIKNDNLNTTKKFLKK